MNLGLLIFGRKHSMNFSSSSYICHQNCTIFFPTPQMHKLGPIYDSWTVWSKICLFMPLDVIFKDVMKCHMPSVLICYCCFVIQNKVIWDCFFYNFNRTFPQIPTSPKSHDRKLLALKLFFKSLALNYHGAYLGDSIAFWRRSGAGSPAWSALGRLVFLTEHWAHHTCFYSVLIFDFQDFAQNLLGNVQHRFHWSSLYSVVCSSIQWSQMRLESFLRTLFSDILHLRCLQSQLRTPVTAVKEASSWPVAVHH